MKISYQQQQATGVHSYAERTDLTIMLEDTMKKLTTLSAVDCHLTDDFVHHLKIGIIFEFGKISLGICQALLTVEFTKSCRGVSFNGTQTRSDTQL